MKHRKNEQEQQKKNPLHKEYGLIRNVSYIIKNMIGHDRFFLVLIPLGMICAPLMRYLWTFWSKFIIDMVTGNGSSRELFWTMLVFVAAQIATTMLNTYYDAGIWWRFISARMSLMVEMNRKAMRIDFEHLENPDVMDCYQKAQNACSSNSNGVEGMMSRSTSFMTSLSVVVVGIAILGTMNGFVVLFMLVLALINFGITNYINKTAKEKVWDPLAPWWRKHSYMQNTTTSFEFAKDIRMFGLREWLLEKYRDLNAIRYKAQIRNGKLWFLASISSNILWFVSQVMIYAWLVHSVVKGNMTLGNFSLYLASSETFFSYISSLLSDVSELLAKSREVDDFRSFLDFDGGDRKRTGKELPKLASYEFVFENVSFKYPKAERYALENLNLTINAGERLAVVGLNGAGKSTMIKLLLRLYEPTEGHILLNGVDVRAYDKDSYYRAFAPVFQQVELFAFPMEENVSMKEPERTDGKRAEECLLAAGMGRKLSELPAGTKTELLKVVYDDGVDLSGGEKQKLALARALYKDAPVVVLDEPTAALDALAESKLYEDFDKLIGGKTAVYISHRLSSTQFCDHVAMFVDGRMVEYGTHEELLEKNGAYAEMFRIQAQYYVEEAGETESEVAAYGKG